MKYKVYKLTLLISLVFTFTCQAQNSLVGDGFGGRLWYKPTNYGVGSYSGYSICYNDPCNIGANQLYGWGDNGTEQLGCDKYITPLSNTPIPIPGMTDVKYYSAGYNMGAIKNDGTGWVWGTGLFTSPTNVISNANFLDGSMDVVSFVKNDGTVWSIGDNSYGNFGDGTSGNTSLIPIQMTGINSAVRVANGSNTTYVLLADGTVKSVGDNMNLSSGMLGNGDSISSGILTPTSVLGLNKIVDIKAHTYATAALDINGDVYVWGSGIFIGDGNITNEYSPKKISTLKNIVAISACADGDHFLALDSAKNCYAWGFNQGQLGVPLNVNSLYELTPILVASNAIDIMAGETFSYIVKDDGSLWCSGFSNNGGSIWLNLFDSARAFFTQLSPSLVPGACGVSGSAAIGTSAVCSNQGIITVSKFGGQAPYQYNIGNGNQASNVFSGLAPGTYTITVTDNNGCVDTLTCAVSNDPNSIIASFTSSVLGLTVQQDSSVQLTNTSQNATVVQWQVCDGRVTSDNEISVTIDGMEECCIKLIAYNNNSGCKDSIIKCFNIESTPEPFILIPNVFTPNTDGDNEVFKINSKGITNFTCAIYNRWGNKLYEWNDANGFWDGKTPSGAMASEGTYYYIVHYSLGATTETKTAKGFLTLIR
jgi:gliding motility-associated-like protein